jgi:hypothetical protein
MAARARDLFLEDPTDQLIELAGSTVPVPLPSATRTWVKRTAAVTVAVPLTMGSLSFGVAAAAGRGWGVAQNQDAVYVAAIVEHEQVRDPAVRLAMRDHTVTAAVGTVPTSPTPTDIRALTGKQVSVVGLDLLRKSRNPKRLMASLRDAATAVTTAGDAEAKVLCVSPPGIFDHFEGRKHDIDLALANVVVPGGSMLPADVHLGTNLLLDERGRTPAQVVSDLALVSRVLHSQGLPERALRDLWPQG